MRVSTIISALVSMLLFSAALVAAPDDYSQWGGNLNVVLNTKTSGANVATTVTGFPVLVRLTTADSVVFLASQPQGQDIRFAKGNGVHLPYQIEQYDPATRSAAIWVLLDTIRGNDSAVYAKLYFGKSGVADSSKSSAVFDTTNGYQGVWHLGEATGQNANDATINGYAGTATGSTVPQDYQGMIGRAKDFDGAASCYSMDNSASGKLSFPSGGPMTLSAWVNTDVINGGKYVLSKGEQYGLYFRSTAPYNFAMMEVGSDNRKRYAEHDSSGFIGKWRHIVGIRTAAKISLYVDGVWVSDSSYAGSSTRATTAVLNIGRQQPNSNQWFDGKIDEVEIASVARSAEWIKLSFENQKTAQSLVKLAPSGTVITVPAAPALVSPTNSAGSVATSPTLSWGTVATATTYRVQVALSTAFSSTVFDEASLTSSSKAITATLGGSTVYFWRAAAFNAGGMSLWSTVWTFFTAPAAPGSPVLAAPTNGALAQPLLTTLSWGTVSGASSYGVQLSTASTFATTVVNQAGLTAASAVASNLAGATVYYWKANALGSAGTSLWSSTWSFSTQYATPGTPALSTPSNGAGNTALSLTLAWGTASDAQTYGVQVSTSSAFGTTVFLQTGLTVTRASLANLSLSKTYFWRVNGSNPGSTGSWSTIWSFATTPTAARQVVDLSRSSFIVHNGILEYSLPNAGEIEISVQNIQGRTELTIRNKQAAGHYSVNMKRHGLAPGQHLIRFKSGEFEKSAKILLTR